MRPDQKYPGNEPIRRMSVEVLCYSLPKPPATEEQLNDRTERACRFKTKRRLFAFSANSAADLEPIRDKVLLLQNLGASSNRCRLGRWHILLFAIGLGLSRLSALANVDAALKVGAVFNRNTGCDHIAGERTVAADIHTIAGG